MTGGTAHPADLHRIPQFTGETSSIEATDGCLPKAFPEVLGRLVSEDFWLSAATSGRDRGCAAHQRNGIRRLERVTTSRQRRNRHEELPHRGAGRRASNGTHRGIMSTDAEFFDRNDYHGTGQPNSDIRSNFSTRPRIRCGRGPEVPTPSRPGQAGVRYVALQGSEPWCVTAAVEVSRCRWTSRRVVGYGRAGWR
jgi:hypothetical protein